MTNSKFSVVAKSPTVAEVTLYDVIDRFYGVSAEGIYQQLKALGDVKEIRVRINSPGGSVFEGTAIYNLLRSHSAKITTIVDGLAASMASVVAMAGDEIEMGDGAYMMIHDPLGQVRGDSEEMRDMADLLDKLKGQIIGIYSRRTGHGEAQIAQWMKEETWMTSTEAIQNRFANRSVPSLRVAAVAPMDFFNRVPEALRQPVTIGATSMANDQQAPKEPQLATYADIAAICGADQHTFICAQLACSATPEAAAKAWTTELGRQRDEALKAKAEAEKEAAEARAEAEKAKVPKPGVETLGGNSKNAADIGDPIAAWNAAIRANMALGMTKGKAAAAVAREDKELHAAYIAAVNAR